MSCERYELWMMDALDETLAESERRQLTAHLYTCTRCRAGWEALNAVERVLTRAPMMHPAPGFPARVEARLIRFETQRRTLIGGLVLLGAAAALCLLALPPLLNGRNPLQAYGAFLGDAYGLLGQAALLGYKLLSAMWLTLDVIAETTDVSPLTLMTYAAGAILAGVAGRRALETRRQVSQTIRNGH